MLLFKPKHVPIILNGTKTQTRRIWKKRRALVGSIHQARTQLFGKPFAHLKILKSYEERLGDISKEDCVKEGYNDMLSFSHIWIKINGEWNPNIIVWVVEFEVAAKVICPFCEKPDCLCYEFINENGEKKNE